MTERRNGTVLGLAISANALRAVAWHRSRVAWAHELPIGPEQPLEEAMRAMLDAAAPKLRGRTRVAVAVGPGATQLRRLHALPPVKNGRALAAIVQQSAGRYFRQNGTPMITTPVVRDEDGESWAAAIEAAVIDAIAAAFAAARLSPVVLVPVAALLGHSAPDGRFTWHDGDLALELRFVDARLVEYRCVPSAQSEAQHGGDATLDAPLLALGDRALRFADAYAAARGGESSPFAFRPVGGPRAGEPGTRRLVVSAIACAAALVALVASPIIATARDGRAASASVAPSVAAARALAAERALADSARVLSELVAFQRGAPSVTLLLATLTRAVEEPTVLVNLALAPDGGTLTAVTPSAADLLAMLDSVPEIGSPEIAGSVTPDAGGMRMATPGAPLTTAPESDPATRPLQRVTVRFSWLGQRAAQARTLGGGAPSRRPGDRP